MNLIPDGPLHPELAATAAAGGLVLTVLARRWDRGRRGARALSVAWAVAALALVEVSPIDVWRSLSDDARLQVVGATLVGALSGWVLAHDAPRASGTLAAHYQPRTPVELVERGGLDARIAALRGARVAAWSTHPPGGAVAAWVEAPADAAGFEAALYDTLRRLDARGADRILVEAPPAGPAWDAVRDRLGRAAHRDG